MQLNKLLTQREAQRRIIATNLEKIQAEDLSTSNRRKLLEILTEKVETIKTLNEKVANQADVDDLVTELVESEQVLTLPTQTPHCHLSTETEIFVKP